MTLNRLTLLARAKVNLRLAIERKRADGYHDLRTVFHAIDLSDRLTFEQADDKATSLSITGDVPGLEELQAADPAQNLVMKADALIRRAVPNLPGLNLTLYKRIPMGAGLGGGSADAAGLLIGWNKWGNLGWSQDRLAEAAAELGSDVPYFLVGGAALGTGRGERLVPWPSELRASLILFWPGWGVSTRDAFAACRPAPAEVLPFEHLHGLLRTGDVEGVGRLLANDFLDSPLRDVELLRSLRLQLMEMTKLPAGLSGSGSTLFLISPTAEGAERAADVIRAAFAEAWVKVAPLWRHECVTANEGDDR